MDVLFPPGPAKNLFLGNAPDFAKDPFDFLVDSAHKFGDFVHFRFGPSHAYLLTNPSHAHYVLVEAPDKFDDKPNLLRALNSGMGHDLFAPQEKVRKRRRMQTAFQACWLNDFADVMARECVRVDWRAGESLDVFANLKALTLRITARVLFDTDTLPDGFDEAVTFSRTLDDHRFQSPLTLPVWVPIGQNRRRMQANAKVAEVMQSLVDDHRAGRRCGIFARILQTASSEAQAIDEAITLFAAGCTMTAQTVAWAFYLLAQNPDADTALRGELDAALGDRLPASNDLPELAYTEMVLRETLRLYPPLWVINRQAKRETRIGNYYVPSGSTLFVSPYVIHHNPRQFFDPESFVPERFAEGYERRINRYAYMPFGAGARAMMEEAFVMTAGKVILAALASRYHLSLDGDHVVTPQASITLCPTDLRMRVAAR